jgi:hypothetical protein
LGGKIIFLFTFDVSTAKSMIISFGSKETKKIWKGIVIKKTSYRDTTNGQKKTEKAQLLT